MKQNKWFFLILGLSCLSFAFAFFPNSVFSETKKETPSFSNSVFLEPKKEIPSFFTPKQGTVIRRPGTITRGPGGKEYPDISVLAPYEMGYTTQKNPTLYWFLSAPWKGKIIFTLNNFESMESLLEVDLPYKKAGIYPISLEEYQIELETGVEYEWFVSLVPDEKNRSSDIVSTASIVRKPLAKNLSKDLKERKEKDYILYAQHGIWYDSIEALSKKINRQKRSRELRNFRAAFLEQIQLPHIAKFDRKE